MLNFLNKSYCQYWGFPKGHSESENRKLKQRRELKEGQNYHVNLSKNISFIDNYCFEMGIIRSIKPLNILSLPKMKTYNN